MTVAKLATGTLLAALLAVGPQTRHELKDLRAHVGQTQRVCGLVANYDYPADEGSGDCTVRPSAHLHTGSGNRARPELQRRVRNAAMVPRDGLDETSLERERVIPEAEGRERLHDPGQPQVIVVARVQPHPRA